ncbi:actin-domain-containing protein [Filobasidium floriforme]|uniref:actin-domain-containing protein n=1 Tax=Filobasidium floriforme TaxID=5210 RepID=UPI001E8CE7A5|nr:actin-domain-containing protein [Filobasidium floriforme]KAH8083010.1 actin-domain-containing protein [Filobasidium floriforme]
MDPSSTLTPPKRSTGARDSPSSLGRATGSSPAYLSSIRKHSLYGTDDRVVIDPGSRIWKIGFSGEPRPRKVFFVKDSFNSKSKTKTEAALTTANEDDSEDEEEDEEEGIWDVDLSGMSVGLDRFRRRNGWGEQGDEDDGPEVERTGEAEGVGEGEGDGRGHAAAETGDQKEERADEQVSMVKGRVKGETKERREEVLNVIRARLIKVLRDVYYKYLLTESRSRRVIVVENPFLPDPIKRIIGEVLLDNLQVRSVSFTPAPILALMAVGRTTGLVLDVGYRESTVVPVFQGRILHEYITSTGIAGKAFLDRLRLLVERYGRGSNAGTRSGSDEVEGEVEGKVSRHARGGNEQKISIELLEEIRSRGCFIHPEPVTPLRSPTEIKTTSSFKLHPTSSSEDDLAETLRQAYSHTSDPNTRATVFVDENSGNVTGRFNSSTQWVVPGWVRERTGEVFFELGEGDKGCSLQEVLAGCLVKLPIDLRRTMIGNILLTGGGGAGLPGFTRRLRTSLCRLIEIEGSSVGVEHEVGLGSEIAGARPPSVSGPSVEANQQEGQVEAKVRSEEAKVKGDRKMKLDGYRSIGRRPYACLAGLKGEVGILNDTSLGSKSISGLGSGAESGGSGSGAAPAWNMGLLSWIGGSLAGALQIGGREFEIEADEEG